MFANKFLMSCKICDTMLVDYIMTCLWEFEMIDWIVTWLMHSLGNLASIIFFMSILKYLPDIEL